MQKFHSIFEYHLLFIDLNVDMKKILIKDSFYIDAQN